MKLPICMISVGIGLGYADAGPTHYANEDFACFRAVVGSSVYTPSDNTTTRFIADEMLSKTSFSYVRLDRDQCRELNPSLTKQDKMVLKFLETQEIKIAILSHGKIFHNCMNIYEKNKDKYVLINLLGQNHFLRKL